MWRIQLIFYFLILFFSCNTEKKREPQPGDDITKEISLKDYLLNRRWLILNDNVNEDILNLKYCPFSEQDTAMTKTNTFVYEFKRDSSVDCSWVGKVGVCGAAYMIRDGKWSLSNDTLELGISAKNMEGGQYMDKSEYLVKRNGDDISLSKIKTIYKKSWSWQDSMQILMDKMKKSNSK